MPWTRKQVKYLLSDVVSPLTDEQKASMKEELHADPSLGHTKKGTPAMKRVVPKKDSAGSAYNWKQHQGRP